MDSTATVARFTKGRGLLRDSLVFLLLSCVSAALFGLTLLLFHSFEDHRVDLGREWSMRGLNALRAGHPADAVQALRVALSYEPNDRHDQFALAQALAASGHSEEAMNYFLTLWEQRPGEGVTNLQLARLERQRGDAAAAINYYRASIFGSWEGDGTLRRRESRLELADYLEQTGNSAAARRELLIAAGNAPPEEYLEVSLGDRLQSIGDPGDALQLYTKALQQDPHRRSALIKAGRAAYQLNDYASAARLLQTALHEPATKAAPASEDAELQAIVTTSLRIPELSLSRELPAVERSEHIVLDAGIARKRLQVCIAESGIQQKAGSAPANLQASDVNAIAALQGRWKGLAGQLVRGRLEHDSAAQDEIANLIEQTETQTAVVCGQPTGDDALLQKLAAQSEPAAGSSR